MVLIGACEPGETPTVPEEVAVIEASAGVPLTGVVGEELQATVTARDPEGRPVPGAVLVWSVATGGGSLASAETTTDASGQASNAWTLGPTPGEQTLRVSSGAVSGTIAGTAEAGPAATLEVTPADPVLVSIGETLQLSATARDELGNVLTADPAWESAGLGVATVDGSGLVTAVGNGQATVSATLGGASGSALVTVEQVVVGVEVGPVQGIWLTSGETGQAQASAVDALGEEVPEAEIDWTSSDQEVATVSESGAVLGVEDGTAFVTASSGAHDGTIEIAVSTPLPIEACRLTGVGDESVDPPAGDWYVDHTVGTLRVVMLFADFEDAPASESTEDLYEHFIPVMQEWFEEASYGRLTIEVEPRHTWYRMPATAAEYDGELRDVIRDAVIAADADVDFSEVDVVYLVLPPDVETHAVMNGPPGTGVTVDGNEIRNGVGIGEGLSHRYPFQMVAHETGHNLGLPDEYWKDGSGDIHRNVGAWDIMGSMFEGAHTLAWHKFWLDWMPSGTIDCLGEGRFERVLTSFAEDGPDAAIVKLSPGLAYVVEVRKWVGFDARRPGSSVYDAPPGVELGVCNEGLLVYSVDANLAPPEPTIEVFPAIAEDEPGCARLGNAPFDVGDGVSRFEDDEAGVAIEIMDEVEGGYRVRIVTGG